MFQTDNPELAKLLAGADDDEDVVEEPTAAKSKVRLSASSSELDELLQENGPGLQSDSWKNLNVNLKKRNLENQVLIFGDKGARSRIQGRD